MQGAGHAGCTDRAACTCRVVHDHGNAQRLAQGFGQVARYAIVRGQVRPVWNNRPNGKGALGYINGVSIAGINVPHAIRPLLASTSGQEKFTAAVAFGQRLEPWIDRLEVMTR